MDEFMDKTIPEIFSFFAACNKKGHDIVVLGWSENSISLRVEFFKEGMFTFDPKCNDDGKIDN